MDYKKILVPIDFTTISESTLIQAAQHSEHNQSELSVIHIHDENSSSYPSSFIAGEEVLNEEDRITHTEHRIDQLLDKLQIGYCEKLVVKGDTVTVLLNTIEENDINLLVMGTHHRVMQNSTTPSITLAMVEKAQCDVLVLHK